MSDIQDKKKDFFESRPWGIPKRYFVGVLWCLATIATWFITHDARKTLFVAICAPFIAGFCMFSLFMVGMFGMMILLALNEFLDEIIPPKRSQNQMVYSYSNVGDTAIGIFDSER